MNILPINQPICVKGADPTFGSTPGHRASSKCVLAPIITSCTRTKHRHGSHTHTVASATLLLHSPAPPLRPPLPRTRRSQHLRVSKKLRSAFVCVNTGRPCGAARGVHTEHGRRAVLVLRFEVSARATDPFPLRVNGAQHNPSFPPSVSCQHPATHTYHNANQVYSPRVHYARELWPRLWAARAVLRGALPARLGRCGEQAVRPGRVHNTAQFWSFGWQAVAVRGACSA